MTLINNTQFDYKLQLGAALPAFSLPATDGKTYMQSDFKKSTLVVFFWCNHCPYVHAAVDAVHKLVDDFKDVDFVAINSNESENYPEDSFENMKKVEHNHYYLHDESQSVAKEFGGECTPHFFVFNKDRKLVYQGRCDDAGQGTGSTHELQDALAELAAGSQIKTPLTAATGCSIKWK